MGSTTSAPPPAPPPGSFDDLAIGIVGTGSMATAHAKAWSSLGMKVFVGSRSADRGKKLAARVGNGCQGGSHAEMLQASNFILLCIMPGPDSKSFIEAIKPAVMGKGKMFCDMSASYTRYYSASSRAPEPYKSHLNWLQDLLGDPSASWVKSWANVMSGSISGFRKQPMEVAGDEQAKKAAFRMLTAAGFEPLDCGSAADAMKIEPCSAPYNRPERWRHPRHLEFNGPNHP